MTPSLLVPVPSRVRTRPNAAYTLLVGLLLGAGPVCAAGTPSYFPHRANVNAPFFLNITGTVRDAKGEVIPGVSVVLKGTTTGTTTDAQGVFRINLPTGNEVLVFSSIGFKKQEIIVSGRTTLDVKMVEESAALNEVVVVGYGTQSRVSLTGAVATIDMNKIDELPVGDLSTALVGQQPGVGVSGGTGRPGDKGSITVRNPVVKSKDGGTTSPLYVIDNVVRTEEDFNLLDQSEVEAISVLKDAAAAIYGARSNQGVVVVTTRRGQVGAPKFSYSGSVGVSDAVRLPSMMSGLEHATYLNNYNLYRGRPDTDPAYYTPDELEYFATHDTNWLKQAWKPSVVTRNALNVSGGGERATYFASVTYNRQNGNFDNINSDKWTFRASTDVTVARGLKAGLSLSGDLYKQRMYYFKQGQESVENDMRSLLWTPRFSAFYIDGVPAYQAPGFGNTNSIEATHFFEIQNSNNYTSQRNTGLNLTANIDYELPFVKGLKARVLYARILDNNFGKQYGTFYNVTEFAGLGEHRHIPGGNVVQVRSIRNGDIVRVVPSYSDRYQFNGYLNYDQQFGQHRISALAFFEQAETRFEETKNYRTGTVPGGYDNMRFATGEQVTEETNTEVGILSYAGRINYSYADKYFVELAARYDGSTNFAPEYRWGLFPSLSAGWVISEERFFPRTPVVSFLKIRGSVGLLGGDATRAYNWQENYQFQIGKGAVFNGNNDRTLTASPNNAMANRRARWDNNTKYNAGIDARFLNDRLSFTLDGFFDHRYNMLTGITASAPLLIGAPIPSENYSTINGFGYEVSLGWGDNITPDLSYRLNTFFAWSDDKQVKIDVEQGRRNTYRDLTGRSSDPGVEGYKYLGMFRSDDDIERFFASNPQLDRNTYRLFGDVPRPGMLYYEDIRGPKDANGQYTAPDGKITEDDMTYLTHKASNHYSLGVNPSIKFKGFSFQATMGMSFGGMSTVEGSARKVATANSNRPAFWADHWTEDNRDAKYPAPYTSNTYDRTSEFWFRSALTAGMRNATISYTFPTALVNQVKMSSVKVFLVAVNPLNFYNPYDYKVYGGAYDSYPTMRSFSLGLNVGL
ncbi:SusC/RagA family TonB-linked outer membrane protein [Hymenobacter aerilatus]|uniref:SusC/RagA family TonB-linked outer membrane protein n=1 Tax=Hymenobacter aerilatus TaxID=2932251 RepID=A0A8T9SP56_9BACT|nr:SusC/RagA family TonB-linked outer membrane protein [Hymenobacter aerilatus]UOR03585.1 SusC/RagA family TonB-linked outer membrane protein [Hymenobacter aerilatus]